MTDFHITCPYCGAVSYAYVHVDRDGRAWASHHCPEGCGGRELSMGAVLLGWARYEAIRSDSGVDVERLKEDEDGVYYGMSSQERVGEWGE